MQKQLITVTLERNESHPQGAAQRSLGPFEWVQFTYTELVAYKSGDDHEHVVAMFCNGYWEMDDDQKWSDIIIGAES